MAIQANVFAKTRKFALETGEKMEIVAADVAGATLLEMDYAYLQNVPELLAYTMQELAVAIVRKVNL